MYHDHRVGVVIPVYNEAEFIGGVIDGLPAYVDRAYVIDDCSTDGTWAEIQRRRLDSLGITTATEGMTGPAVTPEKGDPSPTTDGGSDPTRTTDGGTDSSPTTDGGTGSTPTIVPKRHETNRGRGAAVKTGYTAALDDGMDVVAVMDGDGQMDPDHLDRILDPVVLGEADYAKGNRLASKAHRQEMSAWRLFGNGLLTGLTRVASGYWGMTDSQNGYTAIDADMLATLELDALYDDYGFLNDLLVRLNAQDACIADVPMPARYGDEESGIQYHTFVPRLSLLLFLRFIWRLRVAGGVFDGDAVGPLYGLAGAVGLGGFGAAALSAVPGFGLRPVPLARATLVLTVVLVLVAMVADWLTNRRLVFEFELERSPE